MKYIKNFLLVIMCIVFFVGFTKGISLSVLELFTDKELHVIVFLTYPFITYFLLPNFRYKRLFLFILFMSLTATVELVQLFFPCRTFSYEDIKFSILGCLLSFGLIGYFK
jgi:VanZ family protein